MSGSFLIAAIAQLTSVENNMPVSVKDWQNSDTRLRKFIENKHQRDQRASKLNKGLKRSLLFWNAKCGS